MNAASIGIAGASCGLMESRLAYYCRLSPRNIARENYVVTRYIPLALNRPGEQFREDLYTLSTLNSERRLGSASKSYPRESNLQLPPWHSYVINWAPESKQNVSYVTLACFSDARRVSAEFWDTVNFATHGDFVVMYVCTCNRCRQARIHRARRWCF